MKRVIAVDVLASFLILLFTYSAVAKLADMHSFTKVIAHVMQIPFSELQADKYTGADVVAISVPLAELVIVLLLFFQKSRFYGLFASFSLMLVFTIYLAYMILFIPNLPCSCGGVMGSMGWGWHLVFNTIVTGAIMQTLKIGEAFIYRSG